MYFLWNVDEMRDQERIYGINPEDGTKRSKKVMTVSNVLLGDKWKPVFVGGRRCVNWNWSTSSVTRRRGPHRCRAAPPIHSPVALSHRIVNRVSQSARV